MNVIKLRVLADDSRLRQVKNNEKVYHFLLVLPVEFKNKHQTFILELYNASNMPIR